MFLPTLIVLAASVGGVTVAQDDSSASGVNPFAGLGLPTITITVTDVAFAGVPSSLTPGRYVLAVTNEFAASDEETEGVAFVQLPEGVDAAEFIGEMAPHESDAQSEEGGDSFPEWYGETTLAGGPYAFLGETAYAVIDLTPGEWVLWSEAPGSPQAPVPVNVLGEPPADLPTPAADVSMTMSEFAIELSGPLVAGPQIVEIVNSGNQPHFIFIGEVPQGTTVEDALLAFDAFFGTAAAPADVFSFADAPELFGTGDHSPGTTAWYAVDLPAATVVVACFMTDSESGSLHAMLGMTVVVDIQE